MCVGEAVVKMAEWKWWRGSPERMAFIHVES